MKKTIAILALPVALLGCNNSQIESLSSQNKELVAKVEKLDTEVKRLQETAKAPEPPTSEAPPRQVSVPAPTISKFPDGKLPDAFRWIERIRFGANAKEYASIFREPYCDNESCIVSKLNRPCLQDVKAICDNLMAGYKKDMIMDNIFVTFSKDSEALIGIEEAAKAEFGDGKTVVRDMRPDIQNITTSTSWKIPGGTLELGRNQGVSMQGVSFDSRFVGIGRDAK